jgi:hypothetical protein
MKHEWSSGKESPVSCLICSVAQTEQNKEEQCPKRHGAVHARPAMMQNGDLSDIGKRMREILKEENRPAPLSKEQS